MRTLCIFSQSIIAYSLITLARTQLVTLVKQIKGLKATVAGYYTCTCSLTYWEMTWCEMLVVILWQYVLYRPTFMGGLSVRNVRSLHTDSPPINVYGEHYLIIMGERKWELDSQCYWLGILQIRAETYLIYWWNASMHLSVFNVKEITDQWIIFLA